MGQVGLSSIEEKWGWVEAELKISESQKNQSEQGKKLDNTCTPLLTSFIWRGKGLLWCAGC